MKLLELSDTRIPREFRDVGIDERQYLRFDE